MSIENISSKSEFVQASSLDCDSIRRAQRRNLFIDGQSKVSVNAIMSEFRMHLKELIGATLLENKKIPGSDDCIYSIQLNIINEYEELYINMNLYTQVENRERDIYSVRILHCANRIGEETEDNSDYETTNVYTAKGKLLKSDFIAFVSELKDIKSYVDDNLERVDVHSTFSQWQYVR